MCVGILIAGFMDCEETGRRFQRANNLLKMISKIGKDKLGKGLLDFMKNKGISIDFIQDDNFDPYFGVARSIPCRC